MPLDCAPPISWGPLAGPASTTRCLPGICPLPDTVPNVSTPWEPFLSPLPASCIPDAHQPWSSPCSTAEGTLPLPTSVQPGSLKPPSPHPKAGGGGASGPKAAASCPLTLVERGGPAGAAGDHRGQPVPLTTCFQETVREELCGGKKPRPELRGPGLPCTAGSVTQWGQPPPPVTCSHPTRRP